MANDVSSNYGALFGSRLPAANNRPAANAGPLMAPMAMPPADNASFTPQASVQGFPSVTPSPDMRGQLLALRQQLMDVNRELEGMIRKMDTQQQMPLQQPGLPMNNMPLNNGMQPASFQPLQAPQAYPQMPTQDCPAGCVRIQAGDYLWKIAKDRLGDANRWTELYTLNRDAIGDNPNLLQPGQVLRLPAGAAPMQPMYPQQQPMMPPANNGMQPFPGVANNQPLVPMQPFPGVNAPNAGVMDVQVTPTQRQLSDQDTVNYAREFGLMPPNGQLSPQLKANVQAFLDELNAYETSARGKVFGPGMESLAQNPTETQQFHQSVAQIQQALALLIKSGQLRPVTANGQPVRDLTLSGSFFKVDPQGREMRDAQGNPVMDDAFVAAITQFKQDKGIHQSYRLADGSFGINEYVGPNTIEALKQALLQVQGRQ